MKITIETNETKVTIEEYFSTIEELLSVYKRCAIALTYHEDSWKDAILNEADEINNVRGSQTENE